MSMERVINFISLGKDNAITRSELVHMTGYTDRKVRECIEEARRKGWFICNDQDGMGYYLTEDPDEVEHQYRQDRRRALSVLSRLKYQRRFLKACGREVR